MVETSPARTVPAYKAKREETMFMAYYLMNPRSLELLAKAMNAAGIKVCQRTLCRYSSQFNWQKRCEELDAQLKTEKDSRLIDQLTAMNERQARLGRNMQSIGGVALRFLQGQKLSAHEIATLSKEGVKIERLALGAATSRAEVVQTLQNQVIKQLSVLFVEVNNLEDPSERTRRFALGADRVMQQFVLGEAND